MRSSIIAAVPFVAAALAQVTTSTGGTWHTTVISVPVNGTTTVLSTYSYQYDNPQTAYLTETNSYGVVTGMPTLSAVTIATPSAAVIPAGLPPGVTSVPFNISGTISYYTVSIGSSTTVALGGVATVEGSSVIPTATGSSGSGSSGSGSSGSSESGSSGSSGTATGNGGSSSSETSSGSTSSQTGNAANSLKVGTAGVFGLGAIMAAFL